MLSARLDAPSCSEVSGRLSEFLDDELDPPSWARVVVHLAACEACARLAVDLAATVQALHSRAMLKRPMCSGRHPARASRREAARRLLATYDLDAIGRWAGEEPQAPQVLQSLLFDEDETLRWRAVEAFGRVAAVLAGGALERVREILRRAVWSMNDESGGLLWLGPEVMGAVLANVPALCRDFGPILASFLEEEPFRAGTRWALWRMSSAFPDVVREAGAELRASLADPDAAVRGHAALALRALGETSPQLAGDGATFAFFDPRTGESRTTTVAAAVRGEP